MISILDWCPLLLFIPPYRTPQNSPTPPCPRPSSCHCLSALMLIITTEWICRFPWMSVEPLACSPAPLLLLILSCFQSLPFPFSMGIKREGQRQEMERVSERACPGWGMVCHATASSMSPCQSRLSPQINPKHCCAFYDFWKHIPLMSLSIWCWYIDKVLISENMVTINSRWIPWHIRKWKSVGK